jgi:hypothetical protein
MPTAVPPSEMAWRKSSHCGTDKACAEVTRLHDGNIALRDSKNPDIALVFSPDEWDAFTKGVNAGEFDIPNLG